MHHPGVRKGAMDARRTFGQGAREALTGRVPAPPPTCIQIRIRNVIRGTMTLSPTQIQAPTKRLVPRHDHYAAQPPAATPCFPL